MAKIYYNRIKAGKWSIEDVPERWRDAVLEMLNEEQCEVRLVWPHLFVMLMYYWLLQLIYKN